MKAEVLDEICGDNVSSFKLSKINLAKSENLVYHELIKLPSATKALLKSLVLPVNKKRQFLKISKAILVALTNKLQEKFALNYLICRNSSSFSLPFWW